MQARTLLAVAALAGAAGEAARWRRRRQRRSDIATMIAGVVPEALESAEPAAGPTVAIVMSALNEGESIAEVLRALPDKVHGLVVRTLVVDDGSIDATGEQAALAGARVVRHPRNLGQGQGLRTGFAAALALDADVVVTMDADGQHAPAELQALVGPVVAGTADYVQGSRFLGRYDDAGGARHLAIWGFTALINALAGTSLTDCTNGYRAIRASSLRRLQLVEDRFSASEIIIEAASRDLRMLEVPVHIRTRQAGLSKKPVGLSYAVGYLGVILRSWARTRGVAARSQVGGP